LVGVERIKARALPVNLLLADMNAGVLIGLHPACYVECPQSGSIGAQPVYSVFRSSQIRE
jgi:hypothetical protein